MPFVGHINPAMSIARKLVERKHQVWWYTGQRFQSQVEATGARYLPMKAATDFDDRHLETTFPELKNLDGLARFKWSMKHIFIDAAPAQLHDLSEILREFPADALLCESTFGGMPLTSQKTGLPWASFNILPLTIGSRDTAPFGLGLAPSASTPGHLRNQFLYWFFERFIFRDVTEHMNKVLASVGAEPVKGSGFDAVSPFLFMQGTTRAFEYPRRDLPPQVHLIGPFLPEPSPNFAPPRWWNELDGTRPVVHVTQGTVGTDADHLIAPTLKALANVDVLVIATTGNLPVSSVSLDPLPANARIEQYIPHHELLPHVDVMVTNGGYNGVQMALANGVPLVAAGTTEDKPEVCARIAWFGVGINLKTKSPTETQIRDAVEKVLTHPQYRGRAREVQADFARHDAPTEAAVLLEKLAATKQPVLREEALR